ncbi:uncharacterized protein LOC141719944 [Apium graveolens]|uniref:uncharacterized protein LOC141719944 n=1 Tax=Apium graveolens TaxID=4045 RepID=UPI003D799AFD
MAFIVPPTARKLVWESACQKWREFKSQLTTEYILPHRNQPEKLTFPPADYTFIEKSHWEMFVADLLGDDFKKIHEEQVKRSRMNEYHHLMSRKGYANLEMEWLKKHPEEPIDRSDAWVLARKDKDGNFKNENVKEKAEKIELLKKKVKEGELVEEGRNDVLTMALGKPEHGGRVRGQGSHVKQSIYFDLPRQKKSRTIEERIHEGVKNFMAEETPKIIK